MRCIVAARPEQLQKHAFVDTDICLPVGIELGRICPFMSVPVVGGRISTAWLSLEWIVPEKDFQEKLVPIYIRKCAQTYLQIPADFSSAFAGKRDYRGGWIVGIWQITILLETGFWFPSSFPDNTV